MSVEIRVGCPCPGTPHAEDTVWLREKLGLAAGMAIQRLILDANASLGVQAADLTGQLAEAYLLFGVESWSFVDENGSAVPVNEPTIRARLLSDFSIASPVAEAADDLYMGPVLLPLVEKAKKLSPTSPTGGSTSAPRTGESTPPKRSKRSSTTTTPTAVTERTSSSLAGVSSSSPS